MKRVGIWLSAVAASVALMAVLLSFGQSPQPAAPFLGTLSIAANNTSTRTIAARGADGRYSLFHFAPYPSLSLLSSMLDAMTFLSGFSAPPPQSSAGPPGVGLASQVVAGYADGVSALEFIWVESYDGKSVAVGRFDFPALAYHSTSINIGPNPTGAVAADFNRDGKMDYAVPFFGNGTSPGGIAILLNNGAGAFAQKVVYQAGFSPFSAAAFDLNGDGIPDLAVADNGSGTSNGAVWVLLGKGDGTFGSATAYPAGANPLTVTIADFNGDGRPDLAVGAGDSSVNILVGKGDGTFSAGSSLKIGSSVAYLAAGDFNSDGHMDLAAAAFDGTVSVLLGGGGGTLQLKSVYTTSQNPNSLIVTDYNGDGKLDIVNGTGDARGFGGSRTSGNIDILLGNGDGTFQGGVIYPTGRNASESAVGDFNGDGKPDVVSVGSDVFAGTGGAVFLGNGDGTFRNGAAFTTTNAASVDVADFNRDGKPDIVTNGDILLGKGDGTFSPANPLPVTGSIVRTGDFNGDKIPDLAIVGTSGVTILLGKGDGSFQTGQTYSAGTHPSGVAISDYNRDGKLDLAVASGFFNGDPAGVTILLGNGDGTFQSLAATTFVGQGPYFAIAAGDFNGDGKPDLAVPYELINTQNPPLVAILLGNGDGTFRAPINVPMPDNGNPVALATGDFNGDGKLDIVLAGCCGVAQLAFLAGNGDGTFQTAIPVLSGPSPTKIVLADLNNDHRPDLVATESASPTSGAFLPLLNSGAGGQTPPSVTSTGPSFGSGTNENLTVNFSDPNGAQNLQVVDVLINNVLDGRRACYVAFVPSSNSLYLVDDAGDAGGPYQGFVLPTNASISNGQCTINGANSSATANGNTLTLTLAITFSASFGGNKVVYTSAADKSGANSGWQTLAVWNVPGPATQGPAVSGMTPGRTNSLGPATYTFTFMDTNGWQDISVANVLINSAIDGRHACYLALVPATSSVLLVDDAGDAGGPFQGFTLPGSGSIGNGQCTINGSGSSMSGSGNALTVALSVTFNASFAGNQLFFLAARNNSGGNSNWQAVGSVSLP
jgi:hypothetical protein